MNKNIFNKIFLIFAVSAQLTACTDYLDKSPDSNISEDEAFKNFTNFQGFVEEVHNCIPNKESTNYCTSFNWGEDEIMNTGDGEQHLTRSIDLGDYKSWYSNNQTFLHVNADALNSTSTNKFHHSLEHAWYCIRKMNIGLANLSKLTEASPNERAVIEGELYFYRAWWHFELMQYFGGLPYVTKVFDAGQEIREPRLSFRECAQLCAEDFRKAANLLPKDWDKISVSNNPKGKNQLRVTSAVALGYLGKVLLWASSPLYENGAQKGALANGNTYKYNAELAKKAAEALGECISQVERGETPYSLAAYDYADVYNHYNEKGMNAEFSNIFYTTKQDWKMPGGKEAMMRGPMPDINGSNWNFTKLWGPKIEGIVEHDKVIHIPTANYINYAYGMADGSPIIDAKGNLIPGSGFDPEHPYKNRDPRFYADIVFDGFRYFEGDAAGSTANYTYMQMYYVNDAEKGNMRDDMLGSRTGYFCQKLVPHQCNKVDGFYNWGTALQTYLPYMRFADIYLMYAEACAAIDGAKGQTENCVYTAEGAINVLRDRCGAGHVIDACKASRESFIDEVRRERACELAFEGFRWCDLSRWLLLTEYPYNYKSAAVFGRIESPDFYKNNDPRDAQVTGWGEKQILKRDLSEKHYYFPFKEDDIYIFDGFSQNPGW